jgi:hypothetical protein
MLQTWLDMSSKMRTSFLFPQLMASMPTRELHLLERDTHREAGMHMTKQSCYKVLLPISVESQMVFHLHGNLVAKFFLHISVEFQWSCICLVLVLR